MASTKNNKKTKKVQKIQLLIIKEIEQFEKISEQWWDESGPLKPLHKMNPARLEYIKEQLCAHFDKDIDSSLPLKGLKIADIGCGGGLITEALCHMGAKMTRVDASEKNIKVATAHAQKSKLNIKYKATTAEELAQGKEKFDVIVALELLEHVSNLELFIKSCTKLLNKGGIIIFSTLNRTTKSFFMGIVAAEYILRWLPAGTHDWEKFVKPSEIARHLESEGLALSDISGIKYNPFRDEFSISDEDVDVNYLLTAVQPIK